MPRRLASSLTLIALIAACAGCGGSDDDTTTSASTASTTTSTEATTEDQTGADQEEILGATMTSTTAGGPGVVVISVQSPTVQLKEGDVITEANGEKVADLQDMLDTVGVVGLNQTVQFKVTRGTHTFKLNITRAVTAYLGVEVKDAKGGGALVVNVTPKSPAEKAGLQKGDVITALDSEEVDEQKLPQAVATHEVGDEVELTVERGSNELTVPVTLAQNPATK